MTGSAGKGQVDQEHELRLASAALLIEMVHADDDIKEEEINAVVDALITTFKLTEKECNELVTMAEEEMKQATSLYDFTQLINNNFSQEQKARIVEMLWQVAFADNQLDHHEEHLVRKIADLLYVSHKDFMKAKHRVADSLKL